ncbi:MAG: hypothetical protein MEP44_03905 [Blastomonas sp.]|nr:hypothetical protein [Blastomonas sp.]
MDTVNAGKRVWAIYLKRLAFDLALVFFAGIVWEWAFFEPYQRNGLLAGAIAILIYFAVSMSLGFVKGLSGLVYLWLFGGSDLKELVLADLRNARLPAPRKNQPKRFDYLLELADDETEEANVRVRAGSLYAAYNVAVQRAGLLGGLAMTKALDDATLRYSAEAPE